MKLSNLWKTLTRDQRRAWNAWAKSNKVVLDDGTIRRVSGHKAMTMVMRNRFVADEDRDETQIPWPTTWRLGAVSLRDCGPWTGSGAPGDMRLRVEETTAVRTDWFVWATAPVPLAGQGARPLFRADRRHGRQRRRGNGHAEQTHGEHVERLGVPERGHRAVGQHAGNGAVDERAHLHGAAAQDDGA